MSRMKQPNRLPFSVRTEIYDENEYDRYATWIKENVSSVDRYTPKWNPERDNYNGVFGSMYDDEPKKMTFGFRYEEDAMAFKLILNSHSHNR